MTLGGGAHSWDNESGGGENRTDLDDCSGGLERILLARSALAHRKTSPTHTVSGVAAGRVSSPNSGFAPAPLSANGSRR
jgi:hypothetical protein